MKKKMRNWSNLIYFHVHHETRGKSRSFFTCSRKRTRLGQRSVVNRRFRDIYIFPWGRENWSSFTVLNRSCDKFSTSRNKVFSTGWIRLSTREIGRRREGGREKCFTRRFPGGSMKSVDFHERVSINIYGDIRKVKRNPIIELFRRGRLIVLVNRRVTCLAICNFAF